ARWPPGATTSHPPSRDGTTCRSSFLLISPSSIELTFDCTRIVSGRPANRRRGEGGAMAQAKGILPRREERQVLYKNPQMCGYFIAVKLDPAIDRTRAEAWLASVSTAVDELVARLPAEGEEEGRKVAAVAIGLAPSFFTTDGTPRF